MEDRKREAAAFLAHIYHETDGLGETRENGCPEGSHCSYCAGDWEDSSQPHRDWPCATNGQQYYGRGPIQLSWNYNYGPAGSELGVDLLQNPDLLLSSDLIAFQTAVWFWMHEDPWYKPSPHQAITNQLPSYETRPPGFGLTINIINGGLECGQSSAQADHRVELYQHFAERLGVSPGGNLTCNAMSPY